MSVFNLASETQVPAITVPSPSWTHPSVESSPTRRSPAVSTKLTFASPRRILLLASTMASRDRRARDVQPDANARNNSAKPNAAAHSRLLDLATAEREFGISRWTWRDLIAKGAIPAIRPPGLRRLFLDRHDIEAKLEQWKETAQ